MPELFILADDADAARQAAASLFERVRARLAVILPAAAEVLHIGATAIPGCLTKGDLDIVVRVDPADFAAAEAGLAAAFDRNTGSIRTDAFAAFEDAGCRPPLGIQLTTKTSALDVFHRFAEALRADPALVARYNALKQAHNNRPMTRYRAEKDAFVSAVLRSIAGSCPPEPGHRTPSATRRQPAPRDGDGLPGAVDLSGSAPYCAAGWTGRRHGC